MTTRHIAYLDSYLSQCDDTTASVVRLMRSVLESLPATLRSLEGWESVFRQTGVASVPSWLLHRLDEALWHVDGFVSQRNALRDFASPMSATMPEFQAAALHTADLIDEAMERVTTLREFVPAAPVS